MSPVTLIGLIFVLLFLKMFNSFKKSINSERYELFHNMPIKDQIKGLAVVFLLLFISAVIIFLLIYNFTI